VTLYIILIIAGVGVGGFLVLGKRNLSSLGSNLRMPDREFPYQWRAILEKRIEFYQRLNRGEKKLFEKKLHIFLLNVRIVGIQTEVSHDDRVLIASGAIIPVFRFKDWHYKCLKEVHLFPDKFRIPQTNQYANGLVGFGAMEGKMYLSRKALHQGFDDPHDGKNLAIHEFIHILDKQDGAVDGVLQKIVGEADVIPWLYIMKQTIEKDDKNVLRDYGFTNNQEFLAVVCEYFFEKPNELKMEYPAIYNALDSFFNPPKELIEKFKYTSKYDSCPCGSGRRFGKCCATNSSF
jgi:Mlc titration factor MtfA (ptsG expression regulator)